MRFRHFLAKQWDPVSALFSNYPFRGLQSTMVLNNSDDKKVPILRETDILSGEIAKLI